MYLLTFVSFTNISNACFFFISTGLLFLCILFRAKSTVNYLHIIDMYKRFRIYEYAKVVEYVC